MKILIFYQYFSTQNGNWGTRFYNLSKKWIERGHLVTVVTSIYYKSDLKVSKFIENQNIEGIQLKIINIKINNKDSFFKRILHFIIYMFFSIYYVIKIPSDVSLFSSGPISVGIPLIFSKIFKKNKIVFEVRDLWPDGAIQLGFIKNRIFISILFQFEKLIYKISDLIVCLSSDMKNAIYTKFPNIKTIVITNFANPILFNLQINNISSIRDENFIFYAGNIGETNQSKLIIETAKLLKEQNYTEIKFIIFGNGQKSKWFKYQINKYNLDNIQYKKKEPQHIISQYQKKALVSLILLKNIPVLQSSSPNKLFESIACGVPIIHNTNGWIKKITTQYNIGYSISSSPKELAKLIIKISQNKKQIQKLKLNCIELSKNKFEFTKLSERYIDKIEKLIS